MEDFKKLHCTNLEYRGPNGFWSSPIPQNINSGYYCKKTDSRCVGDYSPLLRKLTLGYVPRAVNPRTVERCPGRETIEDLIENQE